NSLRLCSIMSRSFVCTTASAEDGEVEVRVAERVVQGSSEDGRHRRVRAVDLHADPIRRADGGCEQRTVGHVVVELDPVLAGTVVEAARDAARVSDSAVGANDRPELRRVAAVLARVSLVSFVALRALWAARSLGPLRSL